MPVSTRSDSLDVLAALIHKLGSPLGAIVNHAHLLEEEEGQRENAAAIRQAAGRTACLLAGARRWLDAATCPLAPKSLQPQGVLERVAERSQLRLDLSDESLPEVAADAECLERLAQELCSNARAASSTTIRVRAERHAGEVLLAFGDDGRGWEGLSPVRAVEPFTVGASRSSAAGMGLPVVAILAARMGGRLSAETGDVGSAVLGVRLPAASTPRPHGEVDRP